MLLVVGLTGCLISWCHCLMPLVADLTGCQIITGVSATLTASVMQYLSISPRLALPPRRSGPNMSVCSQIAVRQPYFWWSLDSIDITVHVMVCPQLASWLVPRTTHRTIGGLLFRADAPLPPSGIARVKVIVLVVLLRRTWLPWRCKDYSPCALVYMSSTAWLMVSDLSYRLLWCVITHHIRNCMPEAGTKGMDK